jgi:hypothetical protein
MCEINGCNKPASNLTATESKIIQICKDHYCEIYRK